MTRVRSIGMACMALAVFAGCEGSGTLAPLLDGISEPLALNIRFDSPGTGGPTPSATIATAPGGLTVVGRRDVECGIKTGAVIRRVGDHIDIMMHVERDWLSSCAEVPAVLTYEAIVTGLDEGRYRVRLFETFMGGPPRLQMRATVTIPSEGP